MIASKLLQAALVACLASTALALPASAVTPNPAKQLVKRGSWCVSWYTDGGCKHLLGIECSDNVGSAQVCTELDFTATIHSVKWEPVPKRRLVVSTTDGCGNNAEEFIDREGGCHQFTANFGVSKGPHSYEIE